MSVPVCVCDVADEGPAADREDGEGRDQLPDQTGLHRQGLHLPGTHAHRKLELLHILPLPLNCCHVKQAAVAMSKKYVL